MDTDILSNLELPEHENQLEYAETIIDKHKVRVKQIRSTLSTSGLPKQEYQHMHKLIVQVLEYVGDLSMSIFDLGDEIEARYFAKYKTTPELGKKLWLEHYHTLHHPYNTLKNRCFTLLEALDDVYENVHGVRPPAEF